MMKLSRYSTVAALVTAAAVLPGSAYAIDDLFCAGASVFADTKLEIKESTIHGEVGANTQIKLGKVTTIHGSARSAGWLSTHDSTVVLGGIAENVPKVSLERVDDLVAVYENLNDNAQIGPTDQGSVALHGTEMLLRNGDAVTIPAGDYFFTRVTLVEGAKLRLAGNVRFFVRGQVDLSDGHLVPVSGTGSTFVMMMGGAGGIKLHSQSGFHGAIYAPDAKIEVKGEGDVYGAVVGDEVKIHESAVFHAHDVCGEGPPPFEEVPPTEYPEI